MAYSNSNNHDYVNMPLKNNSLGDLARGLENIRP